MTILVSLVSIVLLWHIGCTLWSIAQPERRTWPPLRRDGLVFRVNSVLGNATPVLLVAVIVFGTDTLDLPAWFRFSVGGALFLPGAYFALGGYFGLGARLSQGFEGELQDSGPYRFSRNPQYVGAILSFSGIAIGLGSAPGLAITAFSCVWWLLLPFAEEPWLREKLGAPYEAYAARVPRYLPFFRIPPRG